MQNKDSIMPSEIKEYIDKGYKIIDIREKSELMTLPKLKIAENIPMSGLIFNAGFLLPNKNEKLIIVCNGGNRSFTIKHKLRSEGYTDVLDISGGMSAVSKDEELNLE